MTMTVDTSELAALGNDLARAAVVAAPLVAKEVARTLTAVTETAQELAPHRTGRLRDDINDQLTGPTSGVITIDRAFYWLYQEFGTSKMAPQPFLGPAVDQHLEPFVRNLGGIAGAIFR